MGDYKIIYPCDEGNGEEKQDKKNATTAQSSRQKNGIKNAVWTVGIASSIAFFSTPQFQDSDNIAFKFLGPLTVGLGTLIGGTLFAKGAGHFLKSGQSLLQMGSDMKDTSEYFKTVRPDPDAKSVVVPNDVYVKVTRMYANGCRGYFGTIGVFAAGITGMVMGYNITKTQVLKHEEIYTGEPKTEQIITENTQDVTQRKNTIHFDDAVKAMANTPHF